MNNDRSHALFARASELLPGGVNSPVRAFKSVGGEPFFAARAQGAHLFDVAPTVLGTLDLAPAEVMDGSALPAIDAPAPREYAPYDASDHAATEDAEVAQRLSDLGYLE